MWVRYETSQWLPPTLLAAAAVALMAPLFTLRELGPLDFWAGMSFNLALLLLPWLAQDSEYRAMLAADFRNGRARKIAWGLLSALALYGLFVAGRYLLEWIRPLSASEISAVYEFRGNRSPLSIGLLLLFWIGPAEELFWRAGLQRAWAERVGLWRALVRTVFFYAVMHLPTGNPTLVLAAAVCGTFWGLLFLRFRSPLINIISHAVWDVLIFVAAPVR